MPQLETTKNLLASPSPLVVGVVSSAHTLAGISQSTLSTVGCDLFELRLDMIDLPVDEIHTHAARLPLPVLITARHPDEGGHGNLDSSRRSNLLDAHLDLAALMDVELRSALEMQPLIKKAKSRRVAVIGSFHDFNGTPSDDVLLGAVDMALQFQFDAVKIATTLRCPGDLARLLRLLDGPKRLPLSVMGMGSLGRVSRIVLARCGSILNYGYLGESNATGQWSARKLKELLAEAGD